MSQIFLSKTNNMSSGTSSCSQPESESEEPPDGNPLHKKEHHDEKEWKKEDVSQTKLTTQVVEIKTVELNTTVTADTKSSGCEGGFTTNPHAMKTVNYSWVNPKLEARCSVQGSGIFALENIPKDEHLVVWTGRILSAEQALPVMDTNDKHYILQVGDGFYQVPLSEYREPADWTNHSCEPNAGFGKQSPIVLSSMREIKIGEQICFDYAMCETDPRLWDPMDCMCGTPNCRGKITANDWKDFPALWARYKGYWSPHVQRLLDAMQPTQASKAAKSSTALRTKVVKKGAKKRVTGRKKTRGPRRIRIV
jgi:hypothetical protein